jgi:hypothetical protein
MLLHLKAGSVVTELVSRFVTSIETKATSADLLVETLKSPLGDSANTGDEQGSKSRHAEPGEPIDGE